MSPSADAHQFSLWLRQEIETGLAVTTDIAAYLNITFGHTDLPRIFAVADSSDTDTLADLLFFPDEALRIRFESVWGAERFDVADLDRIQWQLTDRPPLAWIKTGPGRPPFRLAMPAFAAEALLQRLNVTWQPCPRLKPILENMEAARRIPVRMRLRNARLAWHTGQIDLLAPYLTRRPPEAADFFDMLDFLLSLLADLDDGAMPENFFVERKRSCFLAWSRAEAFERRRLTVNMETLMLQGERASHGDPQHWRDQMSRLDGLSRVLFQRAESIPIPVEARLDGSPGGTDRDLDRLLDLLA